MGSDIDNEAVSRFAVVREMDAEELVQEAQKLVEKAEETPGDEAYLLISQCAHSYRQLTGEPLFVDTGKYGSVDWLAFHSMQPQGSHWLDG